MWNAIKSRKSEEEEEEDEVYIIKDVENRVRKKQLTSENNVKEATLWVSKYNKTKKEWGKKIKIYGTKYEGVK